MKRLHVLYDVEGWAYHNRALAIARYAPADWHVTASRRLPRRRRLRNQLDVVFLMESPRCEKVARRLDPYKTALVVGFNVGYDLRKEWASQLVSYDWIDKVVFNNREYWDRMGQLKNTTYVSNGVDLSTFRETCPLLERPRKALWSGSKYWQELKGYEILEGIFPQLLASGYALELNLVDSYQPERTHDQMPVFYNGGQIFCCASSMEGTPNTALEAAACGCVLVATRVGNMPELIKDKENGVLVERDSASILEGINYARANLSRLAGNMQASIREWDWPIRMRQYFNLFDEVRRQ
ncbi:MAG: glycosyltransferase family 4 protein [Pirellulaceae bacterium]